MPIDIKVDDNSTVSFEEFVDFVISEKIDPSSTESLAEASTMLKRLANNKIFLTSRISEELKNYTKLQESNPYTSQIYMLRMPNEKDTIKFALRACFWPSNNEKIYGSTGDEYFAYQLPHDHNFNFLTVGYHGPGYTSDYYEYSYDKTTGYPNEDTDIRFVRRDSLSRGKIFLYRSFKDVHNQMPGDSLSVSLNLMEVSDTAEFFDQYKFNRECTKVHRIINPTSAPALFSAFACCGSSEDIELLEQISSRHPSPRIRFQALDAIASSRVDIYDAIATFAAVPDSSPALVRELAKFRIQELEKSTL